MPVLSSASQPFTTTQKVTTTTTAYPIPPLLDEWSGRAYYCDVVQSASFEDPRVILEVRRHSGPLLERSANSMERHPMLLWGVLLDRVFPGEMVDALHFLRWSVSGWVEVTAALYTPESKAALLASNVASSFSRFNTHVAYLGFIRPGTYSVMGEVNFVSDFAPPPSSFLTPHQPVSYNTPCTPQKVLNEQQFMQDVPPPPPRELLPEFNTAAVDAAGNGRGTGPVEEPSTEMASSNAHSSSSEVKGFSSGAKWSSSSFLDQQREWKFRYERFLTSLLQRGVSLTNDANDVLPIIREELRNLKAEDRCGAWLLSLLELRCSCLLSTAAQLLHRYGPSERVAAECNGALQLSVRTAVRVISSIDHVLPHLESVRNDDSDRATEDANIVPHEMVEFILLTLKLRCLRHIAVAQVLCGPVTLKDGKGISPEETIDSVVLTMEQCVVRLTGPCERWARDLQSEVLMVALSALEVLRSYGSHHYAERRCQLAGMAVSLLKRRRDLIKDPRTPSCVEEVLRRLREEVPTDFHAILDHLLRQSAAAPPCSAFGSLAGGRFHGYVVTQLWSVAGVDLQFSKTKCLLNTLSSLKPYFSPSQ